MLINFLRSVLVRSRRTAALMFILAGVSISAVDCVAQGVPPFVVTTERTISSILQGGYGTVAVNKFGDVFVGGYNSNQTYEFPANGGSPIVVYNASSGGHAGPVAIDNNQNLIVSEVYNDVLILIPYVNGSYVTVSSGASLPVCAANPTSPCTYDATLYQYVAANNYNPVSGGYIQIAALAFDSAGDSFVATLYDNIASNHIFECDVACNYSGGNAIQIIQWNPGILSIAADSAGDVFFADGSSTLYEVAAGTHTATPVDSTFSQVQGVSFDQSGNLYVSDNGLGIYEIPLEGGTLRTANKFLLFPLTSLTYSTYNYKLTGIGLDQHGNIFATQDYSDLGEYTVDNASLPATTVGSTSNAATLTLTFNHSTTLQSAAITSAGVPSTEFALGTGGTCANGTAQAASSSCTVTVTFTPKQPSLRTAVLTLTDTAGESVAVSLFGNGTGQAVTVDPGTQSTLSSSLAAPDAVAVDGAGNIFVADAGANSVYEYAPGSTKGTAVGSGLSSPAGVATDAGGNLYISDTGNDRLVLVPNSGGVLDTSSQTTVLSNLNAPGQLAVDPNGTVYIANTGNNEILTYVSRSSLNGSTFTTSPVSGLSSPAAVAVDPSGNIYVADTGKNRVIEFSDGVTSTVGAGLSSPSGLAVDPSGSVLVADNGNGRIVRVPNEDNILVSSDQTTVGGSIASPLAIALDPVGNLYVTDSSHGSAYLLNRTAGSLDFGRVNGGSSSADESAILASSGTAGLTLGSPLFAPLGADVPFIVSDEFGNGCKDGATLASGSTCAVSASFDPGTSVFGAQTYTVDFTTGAQNTAAASLVLSGTAVNLVSSTLTLAQTSPPSGNIQYGESVTVTATDTYAPGAGPAPTGTVTFIVDGASGQPQPLSSSGTASLVLSTLSGGSHTVVASYSGDDTYAPEASNKLSLTVLAESTSTTLIVVGAATNPLSAQPNNPGNTNDTVTMTATVTPSIPGALAGNVIFSSGGTTLGSAPLIGSTTGAVTTYTATFVTTMLPVGTYSVVATYAGNANYMTSSSAATQLVIVDPTFTLTANSTDLTSSKSSSTSATITVTSYSAFQGAVDFACSGLPANATCKFLPAILPLTANVPGVSPTTIPALTTTLTVLINQAPIVTPTGIFSWTSILLGLSLLGVARNRRAMRRLWMLAAAVLILAASVTGLSGCGSSLEFKTPTGSSTVTVTATASPAGATDNQNNVTQTLTFNLKVQ